MNKKLLYLLAIVLIPLLSFSNYAFAVGSGALENASFSAKSLASGDAVTAQADEPAAISYNPAGIVHLPGLQIQPHVAYISTFTWYYDDDGSDDTRSSATAEPIPTGYITLNPGELLGNRVAFGVGSDFPFGLSNKYDSSHSAFRYTGWKNWLYMYTIKPTVAFKIFDWLSFGAGPVWYRIYDYGGIEAYPNKLIVAGSADGQLRLNMSGNVWGWQMGVLVTPHEKHQFGFYFRSPVDLHLKGLGKIEGSAFTTGGIIEASLDGKYTLPLNATFGYAFKPTKRWTNEVDFTFTRWSAVDRVFFNHNTTGVSALDQTIINTLAFSNKDYSNGFGVQFGTNYKLNDKITLLAGSWFYWRVIPNDHWTGAVPDSNHLGFGIGTNYKVTKNLTLDFSYNPIFGLPHYVDNNAADALGGQLDGTYFTFSQMAGISITYHWDHLFDKFKKKEVAGQIRTAEPAVTV